MKSIFRFTRGAVLLASGWLFVGSIAMSDETKLGAANDPFRALLFADQSLEALLNLPHATSPPKGSPFALFQQAHEQMTNGEREAAKETLRTVLAMPKVETRQQLWTWSFLRDTGDNPDEHIALQVQGVVLEVPMDSGVDTVAAYSDGTARLH
jgi:hypothetical protein